MAPPHPSADPVEPAEHPARWLRLSLACGSLSAAVLAASLAWGWGLVSVAMSATTLLLAVLFAVYWYAELEHPLAPPAEPGQQH